MYTSEQKKKMLPHKHIISREAHSDWSSVRCGSKDVCADTCVSKVTKNVGHMLPHTLGAWRSVSLTTGAGKVSTLLADGDWLPPFFPSSQSTADLRRCFNHSWYGTVAQRASPHPPPPSHTRYLACPLTSLPLSLPEDTLAAHCNLVCTHACTHVLFCGEPCRQMQ